MDRGMSFLGTLALLAVDGTAWAELGSREVTGDAGIVAYACIGGSARYLIGLEAAPGRGWSHLGGERKPEKCSQPDACEPEMATALRELYEESNCAIRPDAKHVATIRGPSVVGEAPKTFATYVMEIEYRTVSKIKDSPLCTRTRERTDWAWVGHDEFYRFVSSESALKLRPIDHAADVNFWDASAKALRQARRDGLINEQDPCVQKK